VLVAQTEVAIVGAGPYGLSLAAYLRDRGVRYRIFGEAMQTWRERMPAGMTLKSDPFASNLYDPARRFTLENYMQFIGQPYDGTGWTVPLETFVAYGCWFQAQTSPDLDRREVRNIDASDREFALTLADDELVRAKQVVLAVGIRDFAHVPLALADIPAELASHSSQIADPKRFAGRSVTVLGGGASALDLVMLLHEAGATARLVARAPRLVFHSGDQGRRRLLARLRRPSSGLGPGWRNLLVTEAPGLFARLPQSLRVDVVRRMLGPAAGKGVRERVEGRIPLLLDHRIGAIRARADSLSIDLDGPDGATRIETDHLIAATGYRPDVSRLGFLSQSLMQRIPLIAGAPRLGCDFQSSVPGLYFVGLAAANRFGPVQRFAYGARFAAKTVADRLS
jgi:cation diffusion facilitator CzcD-associated flavoprotein CzcO